MCNELKMKKSCRSIREKKGHVIWVKLKAFNQLFIYLNRLYMCITHNKHSHKSVVWFWKFDTDLIGCRLIKF